MVNQRIRVLLIFSISVSPYLMCVYLTSPSLLSFQTGESELSWSYKGYKWKQKSLEIGKSYKNSSKLRS
jgi:hypothetical protein